MKNDIRLIKNEICENSRDKKEKEERGFFFSKFEFELRELLDNQFEILIDSKKTKLEIYNERFEIIESISNGPIAWFMIEKYKTILKRFEIPSKQALVMYGSNYLDSIFTKTLDNFDKFKEKLEKKTEIEQKKNEKEKETQEKKEVYDIIYKDFIIAMQTYKKNLKGTYDYLNSMRARCEEFDNIETFLSFQEFNKIYTKCLKDLKELYGQDIKAQVLKKAKREGIIWALILAHSKFSKSMKGPRKY